MHANNSDNVSKVRVKVTVLGVFTVVPGCLGVWVGCQGCFWSKTLVVGGG